MLPENERRLKRLAEVSEVLSCPYVIIEYQGRTLLVSKSTVSSAVNLTWERVHDPETAALARDMGIRLRKIRGIVLQS